MNVPLSHANGAQLPTTDAHMLGAPHARIGHAWKLLRSVHQQDRTPFTLQPELRKLFFGPKRLAWCPVAATELNM